MKRATTASIKKAMEPYYRVENGYNIISRNKIDAASNMIMSDFSGVYCSTMPTKAGAYVFSIVSVGTSKKTFFKAVVR